MVAQRPKPPSAGISYNVSKRRHSSGSDAAETSDFDDDEQGVYEVSSPYLNTLRFLDEQYGIRRDGNTLMSVSAAVTADEKGNISVGGTLFKVTRGLWELLARKIVNSDVITKSDLNAYKRILVMTNAHLVGTNPMVTYRSVEGLSTLWRFLRYFLEPGDAIAVQFVSTGHRSEVATPKSIMVVTNSV